MKKLYIDGHNQMWRASVSFGKKDNDELYTTTYTFFRSLKALVEKLKPDQTYFVLEGHPQFRYDLYPEYKANRLIKYASQNNTVDKFKINKEKIIELIAFLNIIKVNPLGYECDDAINTLVRNDSENEHIIVSNDSDYIQLLDLPNVKIFNPIKKVYMEKTTYDYILWKSLAGDKSDNIVGVMGDKTAQKLINDWDKFADWQQNNPDKVAIMERNQKLIQFKNLTTGEYLLSYGKNDFLKLAELFVGINCPSMIEDSYWTKFKSVFETISI